MSVKAGERMRRTNPTTGIDLIGMNREKPITQQVEKFWASQENKRNLQLPVEDAACNCRHGDAIAIASSVAPADEALPATATGGEEVLDPPNWMEEADGRQRRMQTGSSAHKSAREPSQSRMTETCSHHCYTTHHTSKTLG
jgi:hypothetical protein